MKKKGNNKSGGAHSGDLPKRKEWHIVSWSQEEDDILREQIRVHGIENWAVIASKFKDKTARQCRRRWFTYLNSDFKKGGWSPEEDMLLCEAQKIFGNRWTEIAKVVSGRTDNAVKNRFATLCKRKAKHEALAKENNFTSYINLNHKRVIFPNGLNSGGYESGAPLKKMRNNMPNAAESQEGRLSSECDAVDHLLRHPFQVLAENASSSAVSLPSQLHSNQMKEASMDELDNCKIEGTFLRKDDPKVLALMQQAELLSSLAIKVNLEKTNQSLESAWIAIQDFLKQNRENVPAFETPDQDFHLEKLRELVEDLRSSNEESRLSWRETDVYASSPASSEYSTGSTLLSNIPTDKMEEHKNDISVLHQELENELQSLEDQHCPVEESRICNTTASTNEVNMLTCGHIEENCEEVCDYSNTEYGSPVHVTPLFRTLAAAIPSPKFSESEKHFLMKTLGMESSPSPLTNASQPPPCKRSLLHCL